VATVDTERQTVRARAKWVHTSPRKARLVADLIRGRSVPEARTILAFSQRAAARDVEKVLSSAVANAESRPDLLWNGDDLLVAAAYVDEGPTLKRWRARARGRVARIRKRTCHITVELAQSPAALAAAAEAAATGRRRTRRGQVPVEADVAPPDEAAAAEEAAVETVAEEEPAVESEASASETETVDVESTTESDAEPEAEETAEEPAEESEE
jgi:large subunit ribosomal protein L22